MAELEMCRKYAPVSCSAITWRKMLRLQRCGDRGAEQSVGRKVPGVSPRW
jgi:hypothetical protein